MKNLALFILLVLVSIPTISPGITVKDATNKKQQADSRLEPHPSTEKILLLSWHDDYLRTTAGTIYLKGVRVVEHVKIDRSRIDRQDNHLEVKLTHNDNQITQVDIYPLR